MGLRASLFSTFAGAAIAATMASVSRAEEAQVTPERLARPVAGLVSVDAVTRLAARDGGQLTELPSADVMLLAPVQPRWNLYAGAGVGFFDVRARAGLHVHPFGRARSGPMLLVGARALAGILLTDAPAPDAPAQPTNGPAATWSYSAILGEAGLGWHLTHVSYDADLYVVPTFLGGRVHYATGGVPLSSRVWSGSAMYYGGTVSLALEFW